MTPNLSPLTPSLRPAYEALYESSFPPIRAEDPGLYAHGRTRLRLRGAGHLHP